MSKTGQESVTHFNTSAVIILTVKSQSFLIFLSTFIYFNVAYVALVFVFNCNRRVTNVSMMTMMICIVLHGTMLLFLVHHMVDRWD